MGREGRGRERGRTNLNLLLIRIRRGKAASKMKRGEVVSIFIINVSTIVYEKSDCFFASFQTSINERRATIPTIRYIDIEFGFFNFLEEQIRISGAKVRRRRRRKLQNTRNDQISAIVSSSVKNIQFVTHLALQRSAKKQ